MTASTTNGRYKVEEVPTNGKGDLLVTVSCTNCKHFEYIDVVSDGQTKWSALEFKSCTEQAYDEALDWMNSHACPSPGP